MGPIPLMKIAGYGNVDVRSAGTKLDPHIFGKVNFFDARASFIEVKHLELQNGSGEVVFNDKKTTFKTHKASLYGKPIDVHGDCITMGELNVYVSSDGHDVKKLVKVIKDSPILFEVDKVLQPFTRPDGIADVFLVLNCITVFISIGVFNSFCFLVSDNILLLLSTSYLISSINLLKESYE